MNIFHPNEMTLCDQATLKREGISDFQLMWRAGEAAYEKLIRQQLVNKLDSIGVIAGLGNNGGDGVVIASALQKNGYDVTLYLVGPSHKRSSALKEAIDVFKAYEKPIEVNDEPTMKTMKSAFQNHSIFIDALFGIGLSKPLKGIFELCVSMLNTSNKPIVAVDIPSGLNADNGLAFGPTIKARDTLIIQNYKTGNLLNDAADHHGQCHLVDAGILPIETTPKKQLLDNTFTIPPRRNNTHKYDYGSLLIFGGAHSMEGAPILSATAAMRSGAGLVSIAFDKTADLHKSIPLEIMSTRFSDTSQLDDLLARKTAIIFGVGLGKESPEYIDVLRQLIASKIPLLIDADGLSYLKPLLAESLDFSNIVITPHIGEMARLLDTKSHLIKNSPLQHIKQLSEKGLTVLLKGPTTLIGDTQTIYFSNTPNPGLAKAGSGDVLSGLIAAFMKSHSPLEAAKRGVILQAKSATICKAQYGESAFLPSDIIKHLPDVIKMLQ